MPTITVPYPPVPKARPRLGKGRVFTPRTTEVAEERIRRCWLDQVGGDPLEGPLELTVLIYLRRPQTHYGTGRNMDILKASAPKWPFRRPDWDNYAKTVSDALNGVAYKDDGQIVGAHVVKRYSNSGAYWVISVAQIPNGGVE